MRKILLAAAFAATAIILPSRCRRRRPAGAGRRHRPHPRRMHRLQGRRCDHPGPDQRRSHPCPAAPDPVADRAEGARNRRRRARRQAARRRAAASASSVIRASRQQGENELAQKENQIQSIQANVQRQIAARVVQIAEQSRARRQADIVIGKNATLASNSASDITGEVLAALNQQLPSVSVTPLPQQAGTGRTLSR